MPPTSTGRWRPPRRRSRPGRALDIKDRAKYLKKLAKAIRERGDELLRVEVTDTGNTITKMKGDVEGSAEALEWYSGLAIEMKGETVPASSKNLHITVREPYGVVARIVPFNHPLSFAVRGLAGPMIAGNTVVIKPPETSSMSASLLAEICKEILPPGTVNIVTGNGMPAGDAIVRHPKVKRIAFTGSIPTGMADPEGGGGIRHQGADARTRRQESVHRLSGCGSRQSGGRRRRRHELRMVGAVLRLHQPADAARVAL